MTTRLQYYQSKLFLVFLGVALGLVARYTLGGPLVEDRLERKFNQPIPEDVPKDRHLEMPDIQLNPELRDAAHGLVPPIRLPGTMPLNPIHNALVEAQFVSLDPDRAHDVRATFHPHGEQVCASGCSASRHPTETLTREHFQQLVSELAIEPMDHTNNALEELLYFGPQTKVMIEAGGVEMEREHLEFLWRELAYTHANVAIRVVDDEGVIRSWLPPTRVPLDRRHVFDMEANNLQPLVTSGTVKRVGLNHIWARL